MTSDMSTQGGARRLRSIVSAAVVWSAIVMAPRSAGAELGAVHPEVIKATNAVHRAKGPEVYAALRELWRTWDRGDPLHVEEALNAFAESPSTSPTARVYSELLAAYARRRRGDLDGALARINKLGFVGQWLTVGPFDNENKGGFNEVSGPELEMNEPIPLGRTYDGKERAVKWRLSPESSTYGWFDFGEIMRPRESICAYATTFVRAKADARARGEKSPEATSKAASAPRAAASGKPITVWVGSAGAFKLFWNGEKVLEDSGYRDLDVDRFVATLSLLSGWNRLTVKVCGSAEEAPKIALRIGDERGAPSSSVQIEASAEASAATTPASGKATAPPKRAPRPSGIEGPMQAFERAVSEAKADPASLEAFARYLSITGGDSASEHKARDLASRAANAAPSVKRLLLAGDLAEDRNQEREWVEQAAAFAGLDKVRATPASEIDASLALEVLLAQARLAATSVNWRDAVPLFERILAIDPDHTGAVLGLVDLYVEAGLKRTALQELEKALARQPSSVALMRPYAGQLRALGRDTEATEIEVRYAALRFDDSSFLSQMVELAVARRDTEGAERWLDRFLRSEPDSSWSRTVAARTYRALGQKPRALAAYQRALSIAPEDIGTLRALSDLYGEEDKRDEQLKLLRQILVVSPQEKDVREYVEHIEPPRPRADEAYAWAPEKFLPFLSSSSGGLSAKVSPLGALTGKPGGGAGVASSQLLGYPQRTLRKLVVTTVFPNGLSSSFHQTVFQPLTDEAAARGRQFPISYAGDRQTVTLRAAKVYRSGGKIDEAIETGESGANDPSIAMYTSQRTFYVTFPKLSAGDVVELRYRIEDTVPRNELADSFGEIEYLQSDEPIASSEYVLITPKARTFYMSSSPLPGLVKEVKEDGDRRIYRFVATDVAPIVPEPAMPPWPSVLGHVHVSTFKTWDQVGSWYWGLAREQFDVDDEVRRKVREITKGLTDDKSKVRAVNKYATDLRYVALEFGIEGIRPRRCAQTLARGWGDCKDKATIIVTMLRELGIPATIVLVRTGMRGDIEDLPASLAPFDHAIAYVPSLDLYLDGTAEHTGVNELPAMDRGAFALQINEGKPRLVRLPQPTAEESALRRKVDIALLADGSAQVGVELEVNGVNAPSYRARYMAEGTRRERAARDIGAEFGTLELLPGNAGLEVTKIEDVEQPVKLHARGKVASFARRDGDMLSLPAAPFQRIAADYASLSSRTLDLVLPALTLREDEWTLRLPQGMKVLRAPLPLAMDTPFGQYALTVEPAPGKISVRSRIAFKKTRITPTEYSAWRVFCESADRAFGQRVVVGK